MLVIGGVLVLSTMLLGWRDVIRVNNIPFVSDHISNTFVYESPVMLIPDYSLSIRRRQNESIIIANSRHFRQ